MPLWLSLALLLARAGTAAAAASGAAAAAAAQTGAAVTAASFPTTIAVDEHSSLPERSAAAALARYLHNISGLNFTVVDHLSLAAETPQIAVGAAAASTIGVPASRLAGLGREGFVITTQNLHPAGSLALSGGPLAPRGALYAVDDYLRSLGVEFLAQDTTVLPDSLPSAVAAVDKTFIPPLEYRAQLMYSMMGGTDSAPTSGEDLDVHLGATINADSPARGAAAIYAPPTFVHTSYALLYPPGDKAAANAPPVELWTAHREWFWPRTGSRTTYGQLCWSNVSLQQYLVKQVKAYLDTAPNASIISVSQNDNYQQCKSPEELAINAAEGTAGGALFRAVNVIADAIKDDYPTVAVDTLAYQWSRPAPLITKPRPNVIIRLCNIECNFAQPLTDSSNAPFQKDMVKWANVSQRTYIWNYVTNFGSFITPFPNYFNVGPDIRYLKSHGVRGIFQEGSYCGPGGDMEELKSYVMARVMLDPTLDDRALIQTFLTGYYGVAAAPHIMDFLTTMQQSANATKFYMRFSFAGLTAPFLTPAVVLRGATSLAAAKSAAAGNSLHAQHVTQSSLGIYYVFLERWLELADYANASNISWPIEPTLEEAFQTFAHSVNLTTAKYGHGVPISEGGPPIDLQALHASLFVPCPSGWERHRPQPAPCVPIPQTCAASTSLQRRYPTSAHASSLYPPVSKSRNLTNGCVGLYGYTGWIEMTFNSSSSSSDVLIGGVNATACMSPPGKATHTVYVDDEPVHTWSFGVSEGEVLTWKPDHPIRGTRVKVATTQDVSWVCWEKIEVFACQGNSAASSSVVQNTTQTQHVSLGLDDMWAMSVGGGMNLVDNPNFEEKTTGGFAADWAPGSVYSRVTDVVRAPATAALKYTNQDSKTYRICSQAIPVAGMAGKRLNASAYIKTSEITGGGSGATIAVEFTGPGDGVGVPGSVCVNKTASGCGTYLAGVYPDGVKGTKDWTLISATVNIPDPVDYIHIEAYVRDGMTGTAWFDSISLVEVPFWLKMETVLLSPVYRGRIVGGGAGASCTEIALRAHIDFPQYEPSALLNLVFPD